jgi:hypothetical protein
MAGLALLHCIDGQCSDRIAGLFSLLLVVGGDSNTHRVSYFTQALTSLPRSGRQAQRREAG